jgi:hypothetical protein
VEEGAEIMTANRFRFRAWSPGGQFMINEPIAIDTYHGKPMGAVDWILMQSTGLADRNGKEIFEGDIIVKDNPARMPKDRLMRSARVKWCEHSCGWNIRDPKYVRRPWSYEVIGNIYETPELLDLLIPAEAAKK